MQTMERKKKKRNMTEAEEGDENKYMIKTHRRTFQNLPSNPKQSISLYHPQICFLCLSIDVFTAVPVIPMPCHAGS
jgi:hypothetical protein